MVENMMILITIFSDISIRMDKGRTNSVFVRCRAAKNSFSAPWLESTSLYWRDEALIVDDDVFMMMF